MAESARPEVRYTAFLSYSHKDSAAAGRLHRRLETYRMPRRLVGTETPRGPVPERLWPIFRDREELPAATDLSETVREALAQSGALIVLCSPNAAGSLWVGEEIETFRRVHPDRPVLAAVLDGDPPDCFPKALRALGDDGSWHEPLATDLRRGRDGAHLGLLKLVAGITGVGLDALVQRDAARKIRRVTAVTAAALIAMLIMAALALAALNARREAERQRREAEGLAEFMLTDLRERLRGVGRLEIMRPVNERALAYHERQLQLYDRPADHLMRARVLQAIGEDEIARSNLDSALGYLREAYRVTAAQLQGAEGDPDRIFAHAQSQYWVGRVHFLRGQWPQALRHYSRYAEAADRLARIAPDNPDYMMEVGHGATNVGSVQLEGIRDPAAAQISFEKALRWFQRAERARPRNEAALRKQANSHAWLADTFYARRLWREALAARQRQHELYRQLYEADPSDRERLYEVALAERAVGRQMGILGRREEGAIFLLRAYENARRLRAHDRGNADWLALKAKLECELLYSGAATRSIPPAAELRREMAAAHAELVARRNPEASNISRCLGLTESRAAAQS